MKTRAVKRSLYISISLILAAGLVRGQQRDDCELRMSHILPVIDYQVEGGLTGSSRRWLIYSDGLACKWEGGIRVPTHGPIPSVHGPTSVHWSFVESGRIAQDKLVALLNDVTNLGFFTMAKPEMMRDSCYQCNNYSITVRNNAQKKTIETSDLTKAVPRLKDIISKIQEAIAAQIR